jgi:hypothetical protein
LTLKVPAALAGEAVANDTAAASATATAADHTLHRPTDLCVTRLCANALLPSSDTRTAEMSPSAQSAGRCAGLRDWTPLLRDQELITAVRATTCSP